MLYGNFSSMTVGWYRCRQIACTCHRGEACVSGTWGCFFFLFDKKKSVPYWLGNRDEKMNNLLCMSYTNRGTSELLVGGLQKSIVTVNLDRGAVVTEVPIYWHSKDQYLLIIALKYSTEDEFRVMKRGSRFICCGTENGQVSLLDMNTFQIIKKLPAHAGRIADLDTQNNILLTCGFSPRYFRKKPIPEDPGEYWLLPNANPPIFVPLESITASHSTQLSMYLTYACIDLCHRYRSIRAQLLCKCIRRCLQQGLLCPRLDNFMWLTLQTTTLSLCIMQIRRNT